MSEKIPNTDVALEWDDVKCLVAHEAAAVDVWLNKNERGLAECLHSQAAAPPKFMGLWMHLEAEFVVKYGLRLKHHSWEKCDSQSNMGTPMFLLWAEGVYKPTENGKKLLAILTKMRSPAT